MDKGQSSPHELDVDLHSGPYLLVPLKPTRVASSHTQSAFFAGRRQVQVAIEMPGDSRIGQSQSSRYCHNSLGCQSLWLEDKEIFNSNGRQEFAATGRLDRAGAGDMVIKATTLDLSRAEETTSAVTVNESVWLEDNEIFNRNGRQELAETRELGRSGTMVLEILP